MNNLKLLNDDRAGSAASFFPIYFSKTDDKSIGSSLLQLQGALSFFSQVFDSSGSFLSYINTSADPLYGPQGLALTSEGHVVVADSGNHCFKVYRYLQ